MKKLKGFSIAEILILFLMISVFMAMTLPIMTMRKKESGGVQKNVMSLISNQTLIDAIDISGDGFTSSKLTTLKATYPAAIAIEEMTWGDTAAINTLKYYLESTDSTATQKTNAKKVMKALCDLGNVRACLYFVTKCAFNNECDVADSDVDLNYYLTKVPASSTNGGLAQITKYGKIFYAHYSKLITAVDNTCCADGNVNAACSIKGTTKCTTPAVYGWGDNEAGLLGNATNTYETTPILITPPAGVTYAQISAGDSHACGVSTTGIIYCWGNGYLGNGTYTTSITPVKVTMPAGVTFSQVSAGGYNTCALSTTGKAYCWGENSYGSLGNGTTTGSSIPTPVSMPESAFTQISVEETSVYNNVCAVSTTGKAYCWGYNDNGEIGNGTIGGVNPTPTQVPVPYDVIFSQVAVAKGNSYGLTTSGDVYLWGYRGDSRVTTPVIAAKPSGVTISHMDAGSTDMLALTTTGKVYRYFHQSDAEGAAVGWGPRELYTSTGALYSSIATFTQVVGSTDYNSDGYSSGCGVTAAGLVYCWGTNTYGKLGNGSATTSNVQKPTLITMPAGVTFSKLSSGFYYIIAY